MPRSDAVKAPVDLPVLDPMLATAGTLPRDRDQWALECKWDGMRTLAYLDGAGGLRLVTRNGNDATDRYPELGVLPELLPGRDLILDGEIVAFDPSGRPSFGQLQERMTLRKPAAIKSAMHEIPVTLMVFDLLWQDGVRTTDLPYAGRGTLLDSLDLRSRHVHVPPGWPGDAADEALAWTEAMGLEGVIAKRLNSRYRPGVRSREWIKIKHVHSLDVVVGAWVPGGPDGDMVKALLVGVPGKGGLRYRGAVGTGFSQAERRALAAVLRRLDARTSPFTDPLDGLDRGELVRWVRPELTGEVEFAELTDRGRLRQPVWKGLRGHLQDEPPWDWDSDSSS